MKHHNKHYEVETWIHTRSPCSYVEDVQSGLHGLFQIMSSHTISEYFDYEHMQKALKSIDSGMEKFKADYDRGI